MTILDPRTYVAGYRPVVGEQIFASTKIRDEPELFTISSYSTNERGIEVVEYTLERLNHTLSDHLSEVYFYPDAPTDSIYVYQITREDDDGYDNTRETVVGYCFTPEHSMEVLDAMTKQTGLCFRVGLWRIGKFNF